MNKKSGLVLPILLGKDSVGKDHTESLVDLKHILIAGQTGSGKSNFNHVLIKTLTDRRSPAELRLFLADPKKIELTGYDNLPHLLMPVQTAPKAILDGLDKINKERLSRLVSKDKNFPYIVVIIDTFSDISYEDRERFELLINSLTSNSDETKIHIVMCDSRPSRSIFTNSLKECFPTRISFKTTSAEDSEVILGTKGAETLLGKGEILFLGPNKEIPLWFQTPTSNFRLVE